MCKLDAQVKAIKAVKKLAKLEPSDSYERQERHERHERHERKAGLKKHPFVLAHCKPGIPSNTSGTFDNSPTLPISRGFNPFFNLLRSTESRLQPLKLRVLAAPLQHWSHSRLTHKACSRYHWYHRYHRKCRSLAKGTMAEMFLCSIGPRVTHYWRMTSNRYSSDK